MLLCNRKKCSDAIGNNAIWKRNGTFDSYMSVLVLFIVYVGCRRDVPDHTSCGFVIYIVLYSGVVVNC